MSRSSKAGRKGDGCRLRGGVGMMDGGRGMKTDGEGWREG